MKLRKLQPAIMVAVLAGAMSAQAALYLQYDGSAGTDSGNISLTYPTGTRSGIVFGVYKVSGWTAATGGSQTLSDWATICLSPGGTISGRELVNQENFYPASPGHLPASWSNGGIYNAAYLYNTYVDSVEGNNTKGVALALAVLDALYDSTAKGTMSVKSLIGGTFQATGTGVSTAVLAQYNTYIDAVIPANISDSHYYVGSVYRPVNPNGTEANTGQDFITKGTMVPEPTTMIAGALLLLPFGASTIRMLRKNRKA